MAAYRILNVSPQRSKKQFQTSFELEPRWIVEAAARRQKWIDQAQSLNIYIGTANGKKIDTTYKMAWLRRIKKLHIICVHWLQHLPKSLRVNCNKLNAVQL